MQQLSEMLRGAVGLHQRGQFAEAEKLYSKVLEIDAKQFDALHLLGLLKHQCGKNAQALRLLKAAVEANPASPDALLNYGSVLSMMNRYEDALGCYDRALAIKPDRPDVHYNRGNALMGLKRYAEALACYDRALALKPNDVPALYNRANVLADLNRPQEALACYDQTLALAPKFPDALINRGMTLKGLNRPEEALTSYDRALTLRPNDPLALVNRGVVLAGLNRHEEALACYDRALALSPDFLDALNNKIIALVALRRHDDALACCDRALEIKPDDLDALNNRGIVLLEFNRPEEALACFDRALANNPNHARTLLNRGSALKRLARLDEALASYDQVLKLDPQSFEALLNRGAVLGILYRPEEALACYDQALKVDPDCAEAHHNRGLMLLSIGDFTQGWKEYEWHRKMPAMASVQRTLPQPLWNGEYVNGTLLAWGKEGLGDQILHASMIPDLAKRADSVVVEVEPRLVPLFARSFPEVRVIGSDENFADEGKFEAHVAFNGLGQFLRPNPESFPRRERGYLTADPEMTASLRRRLSPAGEVAIGLSWISTHPLVGKHKTALLRDFEPLLRLPGVRAIDLQYGDTLTEREEFKQATGIEVERFEDIDTTNDIDGVAALIAACDLVVSVSNTNAHLAGALGASTWVLVPPNQGARWYWHKDRTDSPWYPYVRIKRQAKGASRVDVVAEATAEISTFISKTRGKPR